MTEEDAKKFYAEHVQKPFFPNLLEMITSGPSLFLELIGHNAIQTWRDIIGPTDPGKC